MKRNGNGWWKAIVLVFLLGLILPGFLGIFKTGRLVQEQVSQDMRIVKLEETVIKLSDIASDIRVIQNDIANIKKDVNRLEQRR